MFDFRFNTPIPFLNQGQGSVFMLRECAESISRIKLPLRTYFLQKFSKEKLRTRRLTPRPEELQNCSYMYFAYFNRIFLDNGSDTIKTKNDQFFMLFPN